MPKAIVVIIEEIEFEEAAKKYRGDPSLEIKAQSLPINVLGSIPALAGITPAAQNVILLVKKEVCPKCNGTGVIETGNNDLPCDCPAGNTALFNVVGENRPITGKEMRKRML